MSKIFNEELRQMILKEKDAGLAKVGDFSGAQLEGQEGGGEAQLVSSSKSAPPAELTKAEFDALLMQTYNGKIETMRNYKFQSYGASLAPSVHHPTELGDQNIVKRFLAIIPIPIRDFILTMGNWVILDKILMIAESVVENNQKMEKYRPYVMMLLGFVFPEVIVAEAWFLAFVEFCKWAVKIKAQGDISLSDLVKALTGKIPMTDKIRHMMVKIIGYSRL